MKENQKTRDAESNTMVVRSFQNSPLSALKKDELVKILKHFKVKVIPRCCKGKLLTVVDDMLRSEFVNHAETIRELFPQVNLAKFTGGENDM